MEFIEKKIGKQGIRKGIVASVFTEFIIYVVLIFYHVIKFPQNGSATTQKSTKRTSLEGEEAINNQKQPQPNQQNVIQEEPYSRQYLEQRFRIFFLYHIIGVGFAILYAANNLEIILSYIHLISYCVIIAAKAREKESMMQFCTFLCYFIDVMLMISGTAGMNVKQ